MEGTSERKGLIRDKRLEKRKMTKKRISGNEMKFLTFI